MDNTTIQKFLDEHDYDIRKTHNGRWIDDLKSPEYREMRQWNE